MGTAITETQQTALRSFCDTFVPSIKVLDDPSGVWARPADPSLAAPPYDEPPAGGYEGVDTNA
jgi:hypothetical protein